MGNVLVTGAARFAQPILADIENSKNINSVPSASSLLDNYYVMMSNGTNLIRVRYSDLVADLVSRLSS